MGAQVTICLCVCVMFGSASKDYSKLFRLSHVANRKREMMPLPQTWRFASLFGNQKGKPSSSLVSREREMPKRDRSRGSEAGGSHSGPVLVGSFAGAGWAVVGESGKLRVKKYRRREAVSGQQRDLYALQNRVKSQVVVAGQPRRLETAASGSGAAFSFAVAVRNGRTGEVEFADASLIPFAPKYTREPERFLGLRAAVAEEEREEKGPQDKEEKRVNRRSLLTAFGADRKKKLVDRAVKREAVAGKQTNHSVLAGLASAIDSSLKRDEDQG